MSNGASTHHLPPRSTSTASNISKTFGINSSWTSSLFTSNNTARRPSVALTEETVNSMHSDDNTPNGHIDEANRHLEDDGTTPSATHTNGSATANANGYDPTHTPTMSIPVPILGQKKSQVSSISIGSSNKESSANGDNISTSLNSDNNVGGKGIVTRPGQFIAPPAVFLDTLPLPPDNIGGVIGPLATLIPTEPSKDIKRKKPKSSLVKNNSSFISKTIVHDSLAKKLNEKESEKFLVWANVGRSLCWFDWSLPTGSDKKDPLSKILFTKSHPLCHDVNQFTRTSHGVDIVLGMSSGDAVWLDACSNKYNRINKNGDISRSAVTDIKWVPGSPNYFVTLHANGSLIIFDKDREDGGFASGGGLSNHDQRSTDTFRIVKSLYSSTTGNSGTTTSGNKHNPVAMYKLSHRSLTSVVFSPDRQTLVVTSSDGYMRFLNLDTEVVTDIFPSYYDGILCCAFSPDGKYLATGGQDDLVTIWSMKRKTVIARGYGHQSWVRKVSFDNWNCDEYSYRIGSVGEDGNLLLWDFSPKTLSRPKTVARSGSGPNTADKGVDHHHHRASSMGSAGLPSNGGNNSKTHFRDLSSTQSITSGKSSNTVLPSVYLQQQQQYRIQQQQHQQQQQQQLLYNLLQPHNNENINEKTLGDGDYMHDDLSSLTPQKSVANTSIRSVSGSMNRDDEFINPFVTVIHPFIGSDGIPSIPPVVVKSVRMEENGPAESLSDVTFLSDKVLVASKDGRVWTWSRPGY